MIGIGLRTVHFTEILRDEPRIDFFEAISENFMDSGGRPSFILDKIAERETHLSVGPPSDEFRKRPC